MNTKRTILVAMVVGILLALTAVVISAQDATEAPSSFSDNRINGDISTSMGGVAIYCFDQNRNRDGNTFQSGGIEIWGGDGQKYIELTVDQLRGSLEIMQPAPAPGSTEEATMEATMEVTPVAPLPAATDETTGAMLPVLLARSATPLGDLWLFRIGEDTFALQGTDNTGKFYTYTWPGCALGSIATDTAPIMSFIAGTPQPEMTMEATAEATASS